MKLKELDGIKDNEGTPIDPGIKEAIVAFNLNGFPTINSCAGHTQKNKLWFPHVLGVAPGRPQNRFINDNKIRRKIAHEHNIPEGFIELNPNACKQYYQWVKEHRLKETKKYLAWKRKNKVMEEFIQFQLDRFYSGRKVSQDAKIYLAKPTLGYLVNIGRMGIKEKVKNHTVKPVEIPGIQRKIRAAQKEMKAFTEFLKKKFFDA